MKNLVINWPDGWFESLLTRDEQKGAKRSAVKDQRVLNGIEAQTAVINAGPEFWRRLKEWGDARLLLSSTESSILAVAASAGKPPGEKQCMRVVDILQKLRSEGFPGDLEVAE